MSVKAEQRTFTSSQLTSLLPSGLTTSMLKFSSALHPTAFTSPTSNPFLSVSSASALQPSQLAASSLSSFNALSTFRADKPPQVFAGLRFLLDVPADMPLKEKTLWRRRLLDSGGQIAYSMNKRVRYSAYIMLNRL